MSELKPCPICGASGDYLEIHAFGAGPGREVYHIGCLNCGFSADWRNTLDEAAALWAAEFERIAKEKETGEFVEL